MRHSAESTFIIPVFLIIGLLTLLAFFFGKGSKKIKLPSIIGFMIAGTIAGPSVFHLITDGMQASLGFITQIALGFVALSIGLELNFKSLGKLGKGIIYIILLESFFTFILVGIAVYIVTGDIILSLLFAGIAPASAPAGTVAVIREFKARGNLTKALYAVVGFDDGLAIIIYGFAAAISISFLISSTGAEAVSVVKLILIPLQEIGLSIAIGAAIAFLFSIITRWFDEAGDIFILAFGFILAIAGISKMLNTSLILTAMVFGIILVNTQSRTLLHRLSDRLTSVMPLLFLLFFALAGSNLHISAIPSLGVIGFVYILTRSGGKIFGAWLGAVIGKMEPNIRKYTGLGILSQAGVAIGLSLIIKERFAGLGETVEYMGHQMPIGDVIGTKILTTVTATCIIFEIIGPILAKYALTKAGEIDKS
ncbi:MAG: cation:proton antiporter [Candidatus Cloacimonetes bacterium]|nr:cation:proton antiporter [Candidatus Cloacimonadota bacterium]